MSGDFMIVYEFLFTDENGRTIAKDIWAEHEREAWDKADELAYREGYVDYKLNEN